MKNFTCDGKDKFYGNYRGMVVSNIDPDLLGRLKIQIYPMLSELDSEVLPWAIPAMPLFDGAGDGNGSFVVPEEGTMVWCFFEQGDIYQPVYFAEAQDGLKGLPDSRITNYPKRKVWKLSNNIEFYIDKESDIIKVIHPKGTNIIIDTDGNIIVNGNKDVTINCTNANVNCDDADITAVNDIDLNAGTNISLTAPTISLNGILTYTGSSGAGLSVDGSGNWTINSSNFDVIGTGNVDLSGNTVEIN
jgi:hypothetical protein